jgi:nicotinamide mononucleotide transporter
MSIYGWSYWLTKKNNSVVPITVTTQREWTITMSIIVFGWLILFYFLLSFTDSQNPVWDASVACTGWAGMFLLARRKVENWILLNISNAIAIPLLIMKGLTLFAVLTVILFVVACKGYFDWAKQARKQLETL